MPTALHTQIILKINKMPIIDKMLIIDTFNLVIYILNCVLILYL